MRKIVILILALGMASSVSFAQEDGIQINPDKEKFSMDIAGFQIKLGSEGENGSTTKKGSRFFEKDEKTKAKANFSLIGPFTFGWSCLTNNHYYGDWAGNGDFLRPKNCFTFGMSFCSLEFKMAKNLRFLIGARWSCTNYDFGSTVYLKDDPFGKTMPNFPPDGTGKDGCKMYHSYIGVPIGTSYEVDKFSVRFSVSAEGLLKGYSRWDFENINHYFSALNTFKSRAELIFGYDFFGAFVSYDLTPMFVPGSGNDCHLMTFGFSVAL